MQMMKSIFRGVGQVMFQCNALSGALMLVGIACNSLLMCLFALAGSTIGTCTNGTSSQGKQAHEEGVASNAYKHQCARQRIALKHDLSHTTEYTFHHLHGVVT